MIETIETHVFDLLQADARLSAGGNAYQDGWPGVRRPDSGDAAAAGCVNLFDRPFEPDAGTHRPAVYLGTRAMEADDRLEFETIASSRIEFRILTLPLIVAVQAATMNQARKQRNQLCSNIKAIFFDHFSEAGYWYALMLPGQAGGGMAKEYVWVSGAGGGSQGVAEAMAAVPLVIRYSWKGGSPA
jgi:hypothetical protein